MWPVLTNVRRDKRGFGEVSSLSPPPRKPTYVGGQGYGYNRDLSWLIDLNDK